MTGVEIQIENITKKYKETIALDNITLTVKKGKITTLLGPSGCGKTTLLKIIAGLEKPDHGRILFDGRDVTSLPPEKRGIGFVFQDLALFPHLDVYGNIAFGLKIRRYREDEIRRRVKKVLELVGLDPGIFINRRINELSGGQQQRVAIARALVIEPNVLLLDEPFAHLDFKIKQNLLTSLKRIQKEAGTTVVYVTHDQNEAMIVSNYIAVMNEGKLIQYGRPMEVYENPRTFFVASFFGEINIIGEKEDSILIIRPEKLEVNPEFQDNVIEGIIEDIIFQGPLTHIMIRYNSRILKVTTARKLSNLSPGAKIRVGWRKQDVVMVKRE